MLGLPARRRRRAASSIAALVALGAAVIPGTAAAAATPPASLVPLEQKMSELQITSERFSLQIAVSGAQLSAKER